MSIAQLSVVNAAIDIPGVAFKRNGVIFAKPVKLEGLNKMMAAIVEMEGGTSWWYGDIGLAISDRAAEEKKGENYAVERAEILGISSGHWWDCVSVARFYPNSDRSELSWTHHEVAMRGAGGSSGELAKALSWLRQAKEMNWSVSDLRKHVNLALATARPPKAPLEENAFAQIDELDAWLAKRPALPVLTAATARTQLVRWQALVSFVDQLKAIAGQS